MCASNKLHTFIEIISLFFGIICFGFVICCSIEYLNRYICKNTITFFVILFIIICLVGLSFALLFLFFLRNLLFIL